MKMIREKIKAALISLFALLLLVSCAAPVQLAKAPKFTLNNMDGFQESLSDYKGEIVLLIFFNPRSGGGQNPLLRGYLDYYRPSDKLQIILILNTSEGPGAAAGGAGGSRLTDLGYSVPLRDEDGSVSQAFGASPDKLTIVLVDRDGDIRFRQEVTSLAETNQDLAQQVEKLTK